MRIKFKWQRVTAILLSAAMAFAVIPNALKNDTVRATNEKNADNTKFGASGIKSPIYPRSEDDENTPWTGSYVYFGKYNGTPIKFRVLSPRTSSFNSSNVETMLLDSDVSLTQTHLGSIYGDHTDWKRSNIAGLLNGPFLDSFTQNELEAIALTTYKKDYNKTLFENKVFLLTERMLCMGAYGYSTKSLNSSSIKRVKYSAESSDAVNWFIISDTGYLRRMGTQGAVVSQTTDDTDVSPALNIDLSSILFTTLISGKFNEVDSEYKLTLKDSDLNINVPSGQKVEISGRKVTIPYEISGTNADAETRATIVITNERVCNRPTLETPEILYYSALESSTETNGSFTLPEVFSVNGWGSDYHVYLIAENVNGDYETDYASELVEIDSQGTSLPEGGSWTMANPADYRRDGWHEYCYIGDHYYTIVDGVFTEVTASDLIIPKLQIFMKAEVVSQSSGVDLNIYFPIPECPKGSYNDDPEYTDPCNYAFGVGDIKKLAIDCPIQVIDGITYYILTLTVPAKCMTDSYSYVVYHSTSFDGGDTGSVYFTGETSLSVRDYAETVINGDYDDDVKRACRAMLAYGSAAQSYFGYKIDEKADEGISGVGSDYSNVSIPEKVFDKTGLNKTLLENAAPLSYSQMTLTFGSDFTISMYFKVKDGHTQAETKNYIEDNFLISGDFVIEENGSDFVAIRLRGITINNLMDDYNLVYSGKSFPVNAGQYLYAGSQRGSDRLKPLVKALYNYYLAVTIAN